MLARIGSAAGYGAMFILPALLAFSAVQDVPLLAFAVAILLFPLARSVFGVCHPGGSPHWDAWLTFILDRLPLVYLVALSAALGALLIRLRAAPPSPSEIIAWALSLWTTLVFGTCVAHVLVHRPSRWDRLMGHILAGFTGYPILGYEHLRHHRLIGNTSAAEWPRRNESVWRFAIRRLSRIGRETLGAEGLAWRGNAASPTVRGQRVALVAALVSVILFGVAAGSAGIAVFVLAALLVAFTMQLITYLQHWGLGDDSFPDARDHEWGWEDDCRFQAWITLGLSLHQAHHDAPGQPYFRLGLSTGAPRLPAGYVILMFASFVPPLWRQVMEPARTYWLNHPMTPLSSGRSVACISIYRRI